MAIVDREGEAFDPLTLLQNVERRYRAYLETMFRFRDPRLDHSFRAALADGRLAQGPYVEAVPSFAVGAPFAEVLPALVEGAADEGFLAAVHGDRPLYRHQEEALRRTLRDGENVVVATGTGSGKTEAFLLPVLVHLHREFQAGTLGAGVRALILYPMNALVNDQRERLGAVAQALQASGSPFRFTFGQYVGATPEDEHDRRRHAEELLDRRLAGELVLRSEMRRAPPHILLTNYSMLEYLLLRPDDSPLFDGEAARNWRFLILDEVHHYRGAAGAEMAALLRRLKARLEAGGRTGRLTCLATSATVGARPETRAALARFAEDLFGEPFGPEAVIVGERRRPGASPDGELLPADYERLEAVLANSGESDAATVGAALRRDRRSLRVLADLDEAPRRWDELADRIFPECPPEERSAELGRLLRLLQAAPGEDGTPLLRLRYHFFLRSLEGAFVSFAGGGEIRLQRRSGGGDGAAFEVALCRECGQHYLVGRIADGHLLEAERTPSAVGSETRFFLPLDGAYAAAGEEGETAELFVLCTTCGAVASGSACAPCRHGTTILLEGQPKARGEGDRISECRVCGYRARDPVQELFHGTDGPHAVIATTLLDELPPERRKVLAFADGRQEAAFFAWYADRTYRDLWARSEILRAVRSLGTPTGGLTLAELASELRTTLAATLPRSAGDLERRQGAWATAYREFLTLERRISLEGVGLLAWFFADEALPAIDPQELAPEWPLDADATRDLVWAVLDTLRGEGAVELVTEPRVRLRWEDLDLARPQGRVRLGPGERFVASWEARGGRRTEMVRKALGAHGVPEGERAEMAHRFLTLAWRKLTEASDGAAEADALLLRRDGGRVLNPRWWRVRTTTEAEIVGVCDTCGRIGGALALRVCPRPRCTGRLRPVAVGDLPPNHYRELYRTGLPGPLRAEEHTAQIERERAFVVQRQIRRGEIHLLSSSTTFELGVDLGDLDVIFLRNVPPETANYAQRVGRAGRRSGHPGVAVTFCRRNPHDLYYFHHPERLIRGEIAPPTLTLRNERILRRHATAVVLASFFRGFPERFRSVEAFVGDLAAPDATAAVRAFVDADREALTASLYASLPEPAWKVLGLDDGRWVRSLTGDESRLRQAEDELAADTSVLESVERQATAARDYGRASWAKRRRDTLRSEDVLSFLSRKAVIPKYGFPVDVVELDVGPALRGRADPADVTLARDLALAISEFAPGQEVVANKRQWRSAGLKSVPERSWPWHTYRRCPTHHALSVGPRDAVPDTPCCAGARSGQFVIPQFGFVSAPEVATPTRRPRRLLPTRPFFLGWAGTPEFEQRGVVRVARASPGRLVVLCEGPRGDGFLVCERCGAGFERFVKNHEDLYGRPCSGRLQKVALGHELVTDVVSLEFQKAPEDGADPRSLAYSLAYALLAGAGAVLDVAPTDLDTTLGAGGLPVAAIVFYDAVPGGAGLVSELVQGERFRRWVEAALQRVSGRCGCGEAGSCYGCLRTYRNQFAHDLLRRGEAKGYLQAVLASL